LLVITAKVKLILLASKPNLDQLSYHSLASKVADQSQVVTRMA